MKTILESLKGISTYPIPSSVIDIICLRRTLDSSKEADSGILTSIGYRLAVADSQRWLSTAPNVSQGGTSFDILYSDRERLREMANNTYKALGDSEYIPENKVKFGYKGSSL
jgi:hypothetical protein